LVLCNLKIIIKDLIPAKKKIQLYIQYYINIKFIHENETKTKVFFSILLFSFSEKTQGILLETKDSRDFGFVFPI